MFPTPLEVPPRGVLEAAGLRLIETATTRIVTDLDVDDVAGLAPHADQVWPALAKAFGELADDVPVDAVPLTAFVVSDEARFAAAGIMQSKLPTNIHGRHAGWQFWMRWPESEYYQRHLFTHEAAHCYSMIRQPKLPAGWLEAIAEWFATHEQSAGDVTFGALPDEPAAYRGWGRIELLRQDVESGISFSAEQVALFDADRFQGVPTAYAWAWALSALLDGAMPDKFRSLRQATRGGTCRKLDIVEVCRQLDRTGLWGWWVESLDYGIEVERALPVITPGSGEVVADRGWQAASDVYEQGVRLQIAASGEAILSQQGRPWTSGPGGIRADYAGGVPLGTLLVRTLSADGRWSPAVPIGESGDYAMPVAGRVFLRINDHWNQLSDNSGAYRVEIQQAAGL